MKLRLIAKSQNVFEEDPVVSIQPTVEEKVMMLKKKLTDRVIKDLSERVFTALSYKLAMMNYRLQKT